MKLLIVFGLIAVFVLSIDAQGVPTKKCLPGQHSVLYCPRKAEPSCDNPAIHEYPGPAACGIPDCWCDEPNVRNTVTKSCVPIEECPKSQ